jgi:hypothetical protein
MELEQRYTTFAARPAAGQPRLMAGTHWPALQTSPALQQLQPHWTTSGLQTIPTHWPLLQI